MVWDKTLPSNTSKIRNIGVEVRPNWDAIESGDSTLKPQAINLADRTPLVAPNDPTAIAASVILYSKQDASAKPQVFGIDPDSVITQLTGISPTYTEGANGGTAGGTLNKVVRYIDATTRIVEYSGTSTAFSGNGTVTFPENFTVIYTGVATSADVNVQKISALKSTSGLTLRTENSVQVSWFAQGRIT